MVHANLKIISELKLVLEEITTNPSLRSLFISNPGDFSRNRKLTMQRLIGLIINMPKRSLSVELKEFFEILNVSPVTKGAFSLQRSKLLPLFFQVWNKWLVECFYDHYQSRIKRWKEFRLLAVDGSTAYLIKKPEIVNYFGTQNNQHSSIPMARILQAYDLLNDITVLSNIYPIKTGEQHIIAAQLESLFTDSLTLFDRGFPSYELMYLMINQEQPRHFVMRCRADFNNEVRTFKQTTSTSKIIELTPTAHAIRSLRAKGYILTNQTTIKIRMVKVDLPSGETEILLTNLYNEELYSVKEMGYLYSLRWGIETSYGMQKNQLQLEQFSGHRVICIEQDFAANVFVANLQSLINKQCQPYLRKINLKRKYNYKINRNLTWAAIKNNIVRIFLYLHPLKILNQLQHLFQRNTEPIRPGRTFDRDFKVQCKKRGKYRTLTNYKRAI
jgi:hypothetical protein